MRPPRFRLSTLCLAVALVAALLGCALLSIENGRLRVEMERNRAVYDQVRVELAEAYAQGAQVVKQYEADAAKLEAIEERTKRALEDLDIEPEGER